MLTETQKNVAVRLVVGQTVSAICDEFKLQVVYVSQWFKSKEFVDYKNSLADTNRELVMQYLQSKQMKFIRRLEVLADQNDDLKVARLATVDSLGFSGLENKAIAPPIFSPTNLNIVKTTAIAAAGGSEEELAEIDTELIELNKLVAGK